MKRIRKKIIKITLITACCFANTAVMAKIEAIQIAVNDASRLINHIKKTGNLQAFQKHVINMGDYNAKLLRSKLSHPVTNAITLKEVSSLHNYTLNLLPVMMSCARQACSVIKNVEEWDAFVALLYDYLHLSTAKYLLLYTNIVFKLTIVDDAVNGEELIEKIKELIKRDKDEATMLFIDKWFITFNERLDKFSQEFVRFTKIVREKLSAASAVQRAMSTSLFN